MADLEITGCTGFYQIVGSTTRGQIWVFDNVDGAQETGGNIHAFCDDTRMTQDIADGAVEEGLDVEVNGQVYKA